MANNAANKKSANGKASNPEGQCPIVDKHPPVFFDAHMHIQSGACAPLAPLHARMAGINLSRSTLDEMGTWWAVKKLATGKIGDISPHPTDEIGDMVVGRFKLLSDLGHPAQNSFLGICIVLMMDMDFCHIDGYEGQCIYFNEEEDPKRKGERYYKKYKDHFPVDDSDTPWKSWKYKKVYVNWREDWPLDVEEKNREIRALETDVKLPEEERKARIQSLIQERERTIRDLATREYEEANPYRPPYDDSGFGAIQYAEQYEKGRDAYVAQRARTIEAEMEKKDFADTHDQTLDKFLNDMNTSLFETWNQQLLRTEKAAVKNPFRLMPMYHYEPRRYIKEDGAAPFKQLVENGGVYVGFKMYTSQGYMPDNSQTKAGAKCAAVTKSFFSQCAALDVPIMSHCTPAGFYTHQRELFIDLDTAEMRDLYKLKTAKKLRDTDRLRYFQEHFVHPQAWELVLEANPTLRLCLAHFASDKPLWNDDPKEFSKDPLTKAQTRDLLDAMEQYNDMRAMGGLGRLGTRDLLDEYWKHSAVKGAAKPSIDGSDTIYGKGWIRTLVDFCDKYDNFYTDISYLPTFDKVDSWGLFKKRRYYWHVLAEIIDQYPHMVDKIMFGTDWYMIMLEPYEFDAWFRKTQEALLKVQELLGGKYLKWDLFHQFAVINPIKFYRIHERHPQIKAALEAKLGKARGIDVKSTQEELKRLYETLKRVTPGKLEEMKTEVKQNPLVFTLSEIDK